MEISELKLRLEKPHSDDVFIDVRSPEEFSLGHIPGFLNFPLDHIGERLSFFADKHVILCCKESIRSRHVAELLCAEGHAKSLSEVQDGFKAWAMAGLPIDTKNLDPVHQHLGDVTMELIPADHLSGIHHQRRHTKLSFRHLLKKIFQK